MPDDDKPKKPGPKAERVKLDGDWEDAAERMIDKKRPPEGWPKPKDDDSEDDTPKD